MRANVLEMVAISDKYPITYMALIWYATQLCVYYPVVHTDRSLRVAGCGCTVVCAPSNCSQSVACLATECC